MERDSNIFPPPPSSAEILEFMDIPPNEVIIEVESTTPQVNGDSQSVTDENLQKSSKKKKRSKSKELLDENGEEGTSEKGKKGKKKKKKADTIEPEYITVESGPSETCNLRTNKTLEGNDDVDKGQKKKKSKKLKKAVSFSCHFMVFFCPD